MADETKSKLVRDGAIYLYGAVGSTWYDDGFTPKDVVDALVEIGAKDVVAHVNSYGGIAIDGLNIYNLFRNHSLGGHKVTIEIDGIAASAASLLAMAGDEIIMREGTLMMIHDPSTFAWGTADDLEKQSKVLNTMAEEFAAIYARRSGMKKADARQIMKDETWLTADEAKEKGFADSVTDADNAEAFAPFDYSKFAKAPATVRAVAVVKAPLAAKPAQPEVRMSATNQNAPAPGAPPANNPPPAPTASAAPPVAAPAAFAAETLSAADALVAVNLAVAQGIEMAVATDLVGKAPTLSAAKVAILDHLAANNNPAKSIRPHAPGVVTADERDKLIEGATKGLLMRAGRDGGERNEFTGMRLERLAEESLRRAGLSTSGNRLQMVGRAFTMAGGKHATGDFPLILENVANKSMLTGWDEADVTYNIWTKKGSLSDFKIASRYGVGPLPMLKKKPEGVAYEYATLADSKVTVMLATFGGAFAMTREMVINDDLDAFSDIPRKQGDAARLTVDSLPYALLTANAAFMGGNALFHASRFNISGIAASAPWPAGPAAGAPSADLFENTASWMRTRHVGGKDGKTRYRIRPEFGLFPVSMAFKVDQLITSVTELGQSNPALKNRAKDFIKPVYSDWLDENSLTAWYVVAGKNKDTVEVSFLDGVEEPFLDQEDDWDVDGKKFKVRIDAGANALDPRGLFKNNGA